MSSIAFQDQHERVYVGGRERRWFACLIKDLARAAFDPTNNFRFASPEQVARAMNTSPELLRYWSQQERLRIGDRSFEPFVAELNTAMALGSDAVKLAARIHGQCEIYGFVEGVNRNWLATLIEEGLQSKVFRHETQGYDGWSNVVAFLRAADDRPAFMSYSVCEGFPNATLLVESDESFWPEALRGMDPTGDRFHDAWGEIADIDRWAACVGIMRQSPLMELKPDGWDQYRFGDGLDGFDLADALGKALEAATANRHSG